MVVPQHFRSIIFLPFAFMVMMTSTLFPQYRQICCADFASWRAATFVLDFLTSAIVLPFPAIGAGFDVGMLTDGFAARRAIIPEPVARLLMNSHWLRGIT